MPGVIIVHAHFACPASFTDISMNLARLLVAAALVLAASGTSAQAPDEAAILDVIDRFFIALYKGDAEAYEALIQPHSRTVIVGPPGAEPLVRMRETPGTAERMRSEWRPFRESYWSPTVLQRGRLATVWLPYVLIREEGGFSHCGVDHFTLSKPDDAWLVDFVAFTVEPTEAACVELERPADSTQMRPDFGAVDR